MWLLFPVSTVESPNTRIDVNFGIGWLVMIFEKKIVKKKKKKKKAFISAIWGKE